jgi:hypothetical protein
MKRNLLILISVVWILKAFFTLDDLGKFMNNLPLSEALNAKVIVINSQRSLAGFWSPPYYLLYPQGIK